MMLSLFKQKTKLVGNKSRFVFLPLLFLITSAQAQDFSQQVMATSFNSPMSAIPDQPKQSQVLIFVSASMPQASLHQWFQQAQFIGAPVILRGFVHNTLQETRAWLKPLLEQQKNHPSGIEINPVAFESYGINQVPAVVITTGAMQCLSNDNCQTPAFDVIYGNMALVQALKIMSEKGESGTLMAKQTLMQLKGKSL